MSKREDDFIEFTIRYEIHSWGKTSKEVEVQYNMREPNQNCMKEVDAKANLESYSDKQMDANTVSKFSNIWLKDLQYVKICKSNIFRVFP